MSKIFIALLLCITSFAFGQKCDYSQNEVDAFTKEKMIKTKPAVLWSPGNGNNLSMKACLQKGTTYLEIKYVFNESFEITNESQIIFLFTDDSTLVETVDHSSETQRKDGNISYTSYFHINLNDENRPSLSSKDIQAIRIQSLERTFDRTINSEYQSRVKNIINCVQ